MTSPDPGEVVTALYSQAFSLSEGRIFSIMEMTLPDPGEVVTAFYCQAFSLTESAIFNIWNLVHQIDWGGGAYLIAKKLRHLHIFFAPVSKNLDNEKLQERNQKKHSYI